MDNGRADPAIFCQARTYERLTAEMRAGLELLGRIFRELERLRIELGDEQLADGVGGNSRRLR